MPATLVTAMDRNGVIGNNGQLPWNIPDDLKWFKHITTGKTKNGAEKAVIMGRKTWESIPMKNKPLPGRYNIVVSNTLGPRKHYPENPRIFDVELSVEEAVGRCLLAGVKPYIIGGAQLYKTAIALEIVDWAYVTLLHGQYKGDTYFPYGVGWYRRFWNNWELYYHGGGVNYDIFEYIRTE